MAVAVPSRAQELEADRREVAREIEYEKWTHWPVNWTAIWVGALAALVAMLVFGLIGTAIGAHLLGPEHRVVDLKKLSIGALVFSVCGAFFAFVIGGWITGKIAGILHSEPAMLHGAIAWCLSVPLLLVMAAVGASSYLGGWSAGLAGSPTWASPVVAPYDRPDPLGVDSTAQEKAQFRADQAEYRQNLRQWKEETPKVMRNSALGAVTALLLGLMGSVIGGWLASGEPMNFTHYRTRKTVMHGPL
jgi:uncharacterized membrane protein YeaQ/YmgE (transglycosylase-associated protein family)